MYETLAPSEIKETEARPQDEIVSFETSQGSIYMFDPEGKTTRFKTATGEQQERQDITVFSPLSIEDEQDYLGAYRHDTLQADKDAKVYVVERQPDDSALIVRDISQVKYQEALYLVIVKDGQIIKNNKASLFPEVGHNVFDTRHFVEGGVEQTERHLGNKVTKITRK